MATGEGCFGLVAANSVLPLRDVSVEAEVRGYVLGLQSTLKYQNASADPVEVQFRFPLEQSHAVVGLTAVIDGHRIVAQVKEKEEARSQYDDAIASGQTAAFAQENSGDIFSVSLGNLPPQKEAEIQLQLVGELPIDAERGVRFSLPTTLKPRYVPVGSSDPLEEVGGGFDAEADQVRQAKIPSVKKFRLCVFDQESVEEITSPTHSISVTTEGHQSTVTLSDEAQSLGDDLVVLVRHRHPHSAKALVEAGQEDGKDFMKQTALMVNFFPEFPSATVATRCEFIFLVDRSFSMSGSYIHSARETLLLFLKSLPEDCYFNIVGFGSHYTKLFSEGSVAYSQASLDTATAHTQQMQADLGGTELLPPLKDVLGLKPSHGLARQLFVLTDGAVSNTQACVDVVKEHGTQSRCFTFGIGSGASTALVEGLALAGNGSAEFIMSGERMQPKVIRSLKHANQPAVTNVSVQFDLNDPSVGVAHQCPEKLPPVFAGNKLVVYGLVSVPTDKERVEGTATLKGEVNGNQIQHTMQFSAPLHCTSDTPEVYPVHHLAAKALISDWQRAGRAAGDIVRLSVDASVVSSHTAFIAVDEENSKPVQGALKTWDLLPAEGSSQRIMSLQMQVDQVKSIMAQNISCVMERGENLDDLEVRSASLSANSARFAKKRGGGGFFAGLTLFVSGLFGGGNAGAATRSAEVADGGVGYDESDGSYSATTDPPVFPLFSSKTDILSALIAAQRADGSWCLDSLLPQILSKTEKEVGEACPVKLKESPPVLSAVWATVLVLAVLEKKCKGQQMEWELLATKAEKWLKRQTLPEGVEIDSFSNSANSFVD